MNETYISLLYGLMAFLFGFVPSGIVFIFVYIINRVLHENHVVISNVLFVVSLVSVLVVQYLMINEIAGDYWYMPSIAQFIGVISTCILYSIAYISIK